MNNKKATSEHEANIANLFCAEASRRVSVNLKDALDGNFIKNTKLMQSIAKDVSAAGQAVPEHPLGF